MQAFTINTFFQFNTKQFMAISCAAILITFSLFVMMQKLVANDQIVRLKTTDRPVINLVNEIEDKPIVEKLKIKPKPTPLPQPKLLTKLIEPNVETPFDPNGLYSTITAPIVSNKITPRFGNDTGGARPIVRVEPKYPINAARDGIEGWVKLSFSITKSGSVENIKVLDAMPKRTFNQAAKRALAKWKYKPNFVAGKAQPQDGMMVMLDFKLAS